MTVPRARLLASVMAAVLCALLVSTARRAADVATTSDTAVIESYTRMASRGELLVGAYSRFQWHHPGPLYFYLLAPFYVLAGGKASGLNAGAAAVSITSLALLAAVLQRRRPQLAAMTAAGFGLYAWRAADATASPWNPHVAVLPMAALVVAAADVAAGRAALLPVVALLASLAAQAHIALAPCALVLGAVALASTAWSAAVHRQHDATAALMRTAVVLAAAWALPIYEQFTAAPRGNLTELWQFFVVRPPGGQQFAVALSAWSDMLVGIVRPDFYPAHGWPFVESPVRWAEALSLGLLAALGLLGLRAARSAQRFAGAFAALLVVAAGIALWSTARIDEQVFDHDVFWIAGIGVLVLAAVADLLLSLIVRSSLASRTGLGLTGALMLVAATAPYAAVRTVVDASRTPPPESRLAAGLARDIEAYLGREDIDRPLIAIDQDAWGVAAGAIVQLQKHGRLAAVEDDWVVMFTPAFRASGREAAVITVAAPAEHLRLTGRGVSLISAHEPVYAHARRVNGS